MRKINMFEIFIGIGFEIISQITGIEVDDIKEHGDEIFEAIEGEIVYNGNNLL